MLIRFQINSGDARGTYDREHPVMPRVGDIVHLVRDGEYAFCVVHIRHMVGSSDAIAGHVFLRDATRADIERAGG